MTGTGTPAQGPLVCISSQGTNRYMAEGSPGDSRGGGQDIWCHIGSLCFIVCTPHSQTKCTHQENMGGRSSCSFPSLILPGFVKQAYQQHEDPSTPGKRQPETPEAQRDLLSAPRGWETLIHHSPRPAQLPKGGLGVSLGDVPEPPQAGQRLPGPGCGEEMTVGLVVPRLKLLALGNRGGSPQHPFVLPDITGSSKEIIHFLGEAPTDSSDGRMVFSLPSFRA